MKSVLFVDDEPRVLQGLKASFYTRRKEWDMHFAEGGASAIDLMRRIHFDVLVTDLRMPGVDGATLVAWAKGASPDTIRIVLSGYANEEQSQRLVSLAHRYLNKPCESKKLEDCIARCLMIQSLISSEDLRNHLGSIGTLPPMPSTFAALQVALADPSVDSSKVAAIIQNDPAVSAKVLQVCNSAFFRLPRRVSSIQQAVSYLGLSTVRSMVLSAELFKPGKSLPPSVDLGQLQKHALSVAGIARSLAANTPLEEDAFLAGLLHDVGFLMLGRQFGNKMELALQAVADGASLTEAEKSHIGVDHGTAGAYLLGLWGLPYEVVEAVAHHETPDRIGRSDFDILSAVAIAQALVAQVKPGDVPVYERRSASMLGDDYLRGIAYPRTWDELLEQANALLHVEGAE
jgi:HD-like signal output (HDOD) protein/ActR/RegA family two-component response regulator